VTHVLGWGFDLSPNQQLHLQQRHFQQLLAEMLEIKPPPRFTFTSPDIIRQTFDQIGEKFDQHFGRENGDEVIEEKLSHDDLKKDSGSSTSLTQGGSHD
jgi:hypothetical protein